MNRQPKCPRCNFHHDPTRACADACFNCALRHPDRCKKPCWNCQATHGHEHCTTEYTRVPPRAVVLAFGLDMGYVYSFDPYNRTPVRRHRLQGRQAPNFHAVRPTGTTSQDFPPLPPPRNTPLLPPPAPPAADRPKRKRSQALAEEESEDLLHDRPTKTPRLAHERYTYDRWYTPDGAPTTSGPPPGLVPYAPSPSTPQVNEETQRLQAENARLQRELAARGTNNTYRDALVNQAPSPPLEKKPPVGSTTATATLGDYMVSDPKNNPRPPRKVNRHRSRADKRAHAAKKANKAHAVGAPVPPGPPAKTDAERESRESWNDRVWESEDPWGTPRRKSDGLAT